MLWVLSVLEVHLLLYVIWDPANVWRIAANFFAWLEVLFFLSLGFGTPVRSTLATVQVKHTHFFYWNDHAVCNKLRRVIAWTVSINSNTGFLIKLINFILFTHPGLVISQLPPQPRGRRPRKVAFLCLTSPQASCPVRELRENLTRD